MQPTEKQASELAAIDRSPAASARNLSGESQGTGGAIHLSRRQFLGSSLGVSAALTSAAVTLPGIAGTNTAQADPGGGTPTPEERKRQALTIRVDAAWKNHDIPIVDHPVNTDEERYGGLASFSKGLGHNQYGEVFDSDYAQFLEATAERTTGAFEGLPAGTFNPRKWVNPIGGVAFDMEGIDSHEYEIPAAPNFESAEEAGEIVENYWMALLRDLPFRHYGSDLLSSLAIEDLNRLSDFRGPKAGGQVTARTLFRENLPNALTGPWVSQFLWLDTPFGAQRIDPTMRTASPHRNFMTDENTWLHIQRGGHETETLLHDPVRRYIRNGRDIGEWVHIDVLYQAYFQAGLQLLTAPFPNSLPGGGLGVPLNPGNPYLALQRQEGFGTFGGPYIMTILTEVATRALKAVWYQKWFLHRRMRPEAFAGRVHHRLQNGRPYEIHDDVFRSHALDLVREQYGTFFLPMAFPEGSPMHPAYGAGHATVAGACVTILKALFDAQRDYREFAHPVIASDDGLSLQPYNPPFEEEMTIEGELNKLAMNVAYGRNIAGVHWRTDGIESLRLGQKVAISVLWDQRKTYCEDFDGFRFRGFDGEEIVV